MPRARKGRTAMTDVSAMNKLNSVPAVRFADEQAYAFSVSFSCYAYYYFYYYGSKALRRRRCVVR